MRVLIPTTSYPRYEGDSNGTFVHRTAVDLVGAGHDVTVLAPHARGLARRETVEGVRIVRFRYLPPALERVAYGPGVPVNLRHDPLAVLGVPFFALAFRRAVARTAGAFDVVHAQWGPTAALTWSARRGAPPLVTTLHGSDVALGRGGRLWGYLLRRALRLSSRVVVVSQEQREYVVSLGCDPANVEVIACGVAGDVFGMPPADHPGSEVRVLFLGRLIGQKGVEDLFAAFRHARATSAAPLRLRFVGSGPLAATLERLAARWGESDHVEVEPGVPHDRALAEIAAADVLVLPSFAEGSPVSVAEALALGTPVIASSVGALPEMLAEESLVPPGDVAALADRLRRFAEDPGLRARLAEEGRRRAQECYAGDVVSERLTGVYRSVAGAAA